MKILFFIGLFALLWVLLFVSLWWVSCPSWQISKIPLYHLAGPVKTPLKRFKFIFLCSSCYSLSEFTTIGKLKILNITCNTLLYF